MKMKKIISFLCAAALTVSSFAGLAVTASADAPKSVTVAVDAGDTTANVTTTESSAVTGVLLLAKYSNNALTSLKVSPSFTTPAEDVALGAEYAAGDKIMAWDSLSGMEPITVTVVAKPVPPVTVNTVAQVAITDSNSGKAPTTLTATVSPLTGQTFNGATTDFTFEWTKDGEEVDGETGATLADAGEGVYTVTATYNGEGNYEGSITSASFTVVAADDTRTNLSTATVALDKQTVTVGDTVTATVTIGDEDTEITDSEDITYQWYKSGETPTAVEDATAKTLTTTEAGTFYVTVTAKNDSETYVGSQSSGNVVVKEVEPYVTALNGKIKALSVKAGDDTKDKTYKQLKEANVYAENDLKFAKLDTEVTVLAVDVTEYKAVAATNKITLKFTTNAGGDYNDKIGSVKLSAPTDFADLTYTAFAALTQSGAVTPVDWSSKTEEVEFKREIQGDIAALEEGENILYYAINVGNGRQQSLKADGFAITSETFHTAAVDANITGGTVTLDKTANLVAGDKVVITVAATEGYDYTADSLSVKDASNNTVAATAVEGQDGKYEFTMPDSNVTVTAAFTKIQLDPSVITINYKNGEDTVKTDTVNGYISRALDLTDKLVDFNIDNVDGAAFKRYTINDGAQTSITPSAATATVDVAVSTNGRDYYYFEDFESASTAGYEGGTKNGSLAATNKTGNNTYFALANNGQSGGRDAYLTLKGAKAISDDYVIEMDLALKTADGGASTVYLAGSGTASAASLLTLTGAQNASEWTLANATGTPTYAFKSITMATYGRFTDNPDNYKVSDFTHVKITVDYDSTTATVVLDNDTTKTYKLTVPAGTVLSQVFGNFARYSSGAAIDNIEIYKYVADVKAPITAVALSDNAEPKVGDTLTATVSPDGATATYQWMRADKAEDTYTDIDGETSSTYTLTAGDVGKYIKVKATGTGNYNETVTSTTSIGPVMAASADKTNVTAATAKITKGEDGVTLTASVVDVTPPEAASAFTIYTWQRATEENGEYKDIDGENTNTITAAKGYFYRVTIVIPENNATYNTKVVTSEAVEVPADAPATPSELTLSIDAGEMKYIGDKAAADFGTFSLLSDEETEGVDYKITGTSKYLTGYTEFSSEAKEQEGNYIPLRAIIPADKVAAVGSTAVITWTIDRQNPTAGEVKTKTGGFTADDPGIETVYFLGTDATKITLTVDFDGDETAYDKKTYVIDVSGVTKEAKVVESTADITILTDTDMETIFGKAPSSLGSYTITDGAISGTANYVADYTPTFGEGMDKGYYVPFLIKVPTDKEIDFTKATLTYYSDVAQAAGTEYTTKFDSTDGGAAAVMYLDPNTTKFTFIVDWDGEGPAYSEKTYEFTIDQSGTTDETATKVYKVIPLTKVELSGTAKLDETLTATVTPDGADVDYKWYSAATADATEWTEIEGATEATYKLTDKEVDKFVKVEATAGTGYSGKVSAVSAKVEAVLRPMTKETAITFADYNTTTSVENKYVYIPDSDEAKKNTKKATYYIGEVYMSDYYLLTNNTAHTSGTDANEKYDRALFARTGTASINGHTYTHRFSSGGTSYTIDSATKKLTSPDARVMTVLPGANGIIEVDFGNSGSSDGDARNVYFLQGETLNSHSVSKGNEKTYAIFNVVADTPVYIYTDAGVDYYGIYFTPDAAVYGVTSTDSDDATIAVSGVAANNVAKVGDTVTVTVTPAEGKTVTGLTVTKTDETTVNAVKGETNAETGAVTYTFTMPDSAVTLAATAATATTDKPDTITINANHEVDANNTLTFTYQLLKGTEPSSYASAAVEYAVYTAYTDAENNTPAEVSSFTGNVLSVPLTETNSKLYVVATAKDTAADNAVLATSDAFEVTVNTTFVVQSFNFVRPDDTTPLESGYVVATETDDPNTFLLSALVNIATGAKKYESAIVNGAATLNLNPNKKYTLTVKTAGDGAVIDTIADYAPTPAAAETAVKETITAASVPAANDEALNGTSLSPANAIVGDPVEITVPADENAIITGVTVNDTINATKSETKENTYEVTMPAGGIQKVEVNKTAIYNVTLTNTANATVKKGEDDFTTSKVPASTAITISGEAAEGYTRTIAITKDEDSSDVKADVFNSETGVVTVPAYAITITITDTINTYTAKVAEAGTGYTTALYVGDSETAADADATVDYGTAVTYKVTPAADYNVTSIVFDGTTYTGAEDVEGTSKALPALTDGAYVLTVASVTGNVDAPVVTAVKKTYTVTFSGTEIADATVEHGAKVTKPEDPTKDGKEFDGWYADAELTTEFDFNTTITAATTIYAKWNDPAPTTFAVTYTAADVSAIKYADNAEGLAEGTAIEASDTEIEAGKVVSVTAAAKADHTATITVKDADNADVTVTDGVFTMPSKAVTITVAYTATTKWTAFAGTDADKYTIAAADDGDDVVTTLTIKEGNTANFTYDLAADLATVPEAWNAGELTVTYELALPEGFAIPNNWFVDLSTANTRVQSWGGGDTNLFGRTHGYSSWNTLHFVGGSASTADDANTGVITADLKAAKQDGNYYTYTNKVDLKNGKIFAGSTSAETNAPLHSVLMTKTAQTFVPTKLYLNFGVDQAVTADTSVMIKNVTVSYNAEPTSYTIAKSDTDATYTLSATSANAGDTVTVTPTSGSKITAITVAGAPDAAIAEDGATATFTMPAQNVTVNVTEESAVTTYTITKASTENGSFAVDKESAAEGATVTITPSADTGYEVKAVSVVFEGEGSPITPTEGTTDGTYEFTMPAADVTVGVTFKAAEVTPTTYTITAAEGIENGSITDITTSPAESGASVSFKVSPADGYQLKDGTVKATYNNGESDVELTVGDGITYDSDNTTYTFSMPAGNVTVTAEFEEILEYTATLVATDEARWGSNTQLETHKNLEKQYFNNDAESSWAGYAYLLFNLDSSAIAANDIAEATLSMYIDQGGRAGTNRDSVISYLNDDSADISSNDFSGGYTTAKTTLATLTTVSTHDSTAYVADVSAGVKAKTSAGKITFVLSGNGGGAEVYGYAADAAKKPVLTIKKGRTVTFTTAETDKTFTVTVKKDGTAYKTVTVTGGTGSVVLAPGEYTYDVAKANGYKASTGNTLTVGATAVTEALTHTPNVPTTVTVTAPESTTVTTSGGELTYTAAVKDQDEDAIDAPLTWSIVEETDKITVDGGVVTVAEGATAGTYTVKAALTADATKSDSKTFTVVAKTPATVTVNYTNNGTTVKTQEIEVTSAGPFVGDEYTLDTSYYTNITFDKVAAADDESNSTTNSYRNYYVANNVDATGFKITAAEAKSDDNHIDVPLTYDGKDYYYQEDFEGDTTGYSVGKYNDDNIGYEVLTFNDNKMMAFKGGNSNGQRRAYIKFGNMPEFDANVSYTYEMKFVNGTGGGGASYAKNSTLFLMSDNTSNNGSLRIPGGSSTNTEVSAGYTVGLKNLAAAADTRYKTQLLAGTSSTLTTQAAISSYDSWAPTINGNCTAFSHITAPNLGTMKMTVVGSVAHITISNNSGTELVDQYVNIADPTYRSVKGILSFVGSRGFQLFDDIQIYAAQNDDLFTSTALTSTAVTITNDDTKVGTVLTAALDVNTETAAYTWQRSTDGETWTDIATTVDNTYTLVDADLGNTIRVIATGRGLYTGTLTSTATETVVVAE